MGLIALHSSKDVASRAACGVLKHGLEIHHEKMDIFFMCQWKNHWTKWWVFQPRFDHQRVTNFSYDLCDSLDSYDILCPLLLFDTVGLQIPFCQCDFRLWGHQSNWHPPLILWALTSRQQRLVQTCMPGLPTCNKTCRNREKVDFKDWQWCQWCPFSILATRLGFLGSRPLGCVSMPL